MRIKDLVVEVMLERPARRQGLARQLQGLTRAGEKLSARLEKAAGTPKEHGTLRHIIGIERWGQRRLRLATEFGALELGADADSAPDFGRGARRVRDPAVAFHDDHHPYKPLETATWPELREKFRTTRQETVAFAERLAKRPDAEVAQALTHTKVPHNDLGALTLGGWLRYLQLHASLEGRRIRPQRAR